MYSQDWSVSIIIPTCNEAKQLPVLLDYLYALPHQEYIKEVIISDGQSTDDTLAVASRFPVKTVENPCRSRAIQLNNGAQFATGNIYYFLHADSFPPQNFISNITQQVNKGYHSGCFRLQFDATHWLLRAFAWFTRFDVNLFRYGDQSLFITSKLFQRIGGYSEQFLVLEDQEIIRRIKRQAAFIVISDYITTSARKYRRNGVFRLKAIFLYVHLMAIFGTPQPVIAQRYRQLCR